MAAIESEIYFRVWFWRGTRLRKWKSTGIPNFDEISQSTAEIKLIPDGRHFRILSPVSVFV